MVHEQSIGCQVAPRTRTRTPMDPLQASVDLVVLVESPGSVARGIQRVGRAGHQVGQPSTGTVFPKFRGDLVESAQGRYITAEDVGTSSRDMAVIAQQTDQARTEGIRHLRRAQREDASAGIIVHRIRGSSDRLARNEQHPQGE